MILVSILDLYMSKEKYFVAIFYSYLFMDLSLVYFIIHSRKSHPAKPQLRFK